jgi:hypothetical protein
MLLKKNIPQRIVIYPRDVVNIIGCKIRTAQRLIQTMRTVFEKEEFQFITVQEFSFFTGIDEELIRQSLV